MDLLSQESYLKYYQLINPQYISWDFYSQYLDKEPPFGELGAIVFLRTYSRFVLELKRREKFAETCLRVVEYSLSLDTVSDTYALREEAEQLFDCLFSLRGFASGRSYWVAGTEQTKRCGSATWNCCFRTMDSISAFSEVFYWLLLGAGVGFSVENKYVSKLPTFNTQVEIKHTPYIFNQSYYPNTLIYPNESRLDGYTLTDTDLVVSDAEFLQHWGFQDEEHFTVIVGDSKEGWCTALRVLLYLLTLPNTKSITFNYNNVRPKGERIKVFGGRASGHQNLQDVLQRTHDIVCESKGKLNSLNVLDEVNTIGVGVVSGGVRRTAEIALGDADDTYFIEAKQDLWTDESKAKYRNIRVMSNNSVVFYENPGLEKIREIVRRIQTNGEPGFSIVGNAQKHDPNIKGFNPCHEASLDSHQSCNLVTENLVAHIFDGLLDYALLQDTLRLITRVACRQTTASQWHPQWDAVQKRDRLIGVSMTGVEDAFDILNWGDEQKADFYNWAADIVRDEADKYNAHLGIEKSKRVTLVKPEGCEVIESLRVFNEGILRIDEIDSNISNKTGFYKNTVSLTTTHWNDKVSSLFNNGLSDIAEITLNNGRKLKTTVEHRFHVQGTWKRVLDLTIGDVLDVELGSYQNKNNTPMYVPTNGTGLKKVSLPTRMSEPLAWFLAAIYANGSTSTRGYVDFCSGHLLVCTKFKQIVKQLFGVNVEFKKDSIKDMYRTRINSVDIWQYLKENNCLKSDQFDRVPLVVRKSSRQSVLAFVAGYLDTDGCFKNKTCAITSTKLDFARNLQEVCEAVGLSFSAYETKRETTKGECHYIDLQLSRTFSTKDAIDYINQNCIKAQEHPILYSSKSHKNPYKVKSITLLDNLEMTYDIEVENSHCYLNGGIKSHNTLSQLPTVSSGIGKAYAPYYLRRIRFSSLDPLALALYQQGVPVVPENGQGDDLFSEKCNTWVFTFPIKTNAKIRAIDEPIEEQFKRYLLVQNTYVREGYNASNTMTVAPMSGTKPLN
jgi:adenosylcobalamin-dependent ribonucleoside-triphosphate reductase